MTGTVLVPTFQGLNLTLTIVILALKYKDKNCPVNIPRLKQIEIPQTGISTLDRFSSLYKKDRFPSQVSRFQGLMLWQVFWTVGSSGFSSEICQIFLFYLSLLNLYKIKLLKLVLCFLWVCVCLEEQIYVKIFIKHEVYPKILLLKYNQIMQVLNWKTSSSI